MARLYKFEIKNGGDFLAGWYTDNGQFEMDKEAVFLSTKERAAMMVLCGELVDFIKRNNITSFEIKKL
jgi:hypothetical protein